MWQYFEAVRNYLTGATRVRALVTRAALPGLDVGTSDDPNAEKAALRGIEPENADWTAHDRTPVAVFGTSTASYRRMADARRI